VQDALGQAQDVPRVLPEAAPKAQEIQGFLDRAMADLGGGDRGSKAPSFGGTDYQAWVFRWEQWAVGEDLWEFYDGTAKRPEPPENADAAAKEAMLPEQRRWDKANQKAFAALVQALQPDELVKLIREYGARAVPRAPVGTPRQPARPAEAWKRLEGYFCQKQFSSQIIFERQLMALRMNPEESVAQYWARADDLRQNLEAVGGEMSKGTWMNRIIAGLPADWENVQVYLTTQFMTLTEEGLLFALTSEGNRRAEQKQGDGFNGQGLKDRDRSGKGGKKYKQGKQGQRRQKQIGKDGKWGELGPAPLGHCHGCHRKGHGWTKCPIRPGKAKPTFVERRDGGRGGQANPTDGQEEDSDSDSEGGGEVAMVQQHQAVGKCSQVDGQDSVHGYVDSGASHNFTPNISDFNGALQPPEVRTVRVGDGKTLRVLGMGNVTIKGESGLLTLTKVHLVPALHSRLISVPHLTAKGFEVLFKGEDCTLSRGGKVWMRAKKVRGEEHSLHQVRLQIVGKPKGGEAAVVIGTPKEQKEGKQSMALVSQAVMGQTELAHQRMGHVAESTLRKMAGAGHLKGLELGEEVLPPCKACLLGKMKHQPYKENLHPEGNPKSAEAPLALVHMDLWGPARTPTMGGKCIYVLSLLDDCTRYVWSILLPSKESKGVAQALEAWRVKAERESGRQLKALRSDGGMEFQGEVATWAAKLGVTRQLTAPYSPQQNRRVGRWHTTKAESIRAMLLHSGAPVSL
jgi:hypothetical protein